MSSQKRNRILVVLPFVLLTVFVVVRIAIAMLHGAGGSAGETKFAKRVPISQLYNPIVITTGSPSELAPWQNGAFIDSDSTEAAQLVGDTVEKEGGGLSVKQRKDLSDSIGRFFRAYATGHFDNYFDFKTRGKKYNLNFSGNSVELINSLGIVNDRQLPQEPKAKLEKIWSMISAIKATADTSPRLIKIQPSQIKILISTNKSVLSGIQRYAKTVSTMYPNFAPNCLIKYDQSPEMVVKDEGYLIVALLQVNARYSTSDTATPIFATFYWSSKTEQWYPWELAKYRASNFTVLF